MTPEAREKLIAAAAEAGAAGMWLLRGPADAALTWTFDPDSIKRMGEWTMLLLGRPSELVMVIRFTEGDGEHTGLEFRTEPDWDRLLELVLEPPSVPRAGR